MSGYILLVLSCVIGVFIIRFLQSYDIHKKDPLGKMVLVTIVGGVDSFAMAIGLYLGLEQVGVSDIMNWHGAIAGIVRWCGCKLR